MIGLLAKLIPAEYRLAVTLIAAAVWTALVASAAGSAGWKVSRWRADAHWTEVAGKCSADLTASKASVTALTASLDAQNRAVLALKSQSDAITEAQKQAKQQAESEAAASARRIAQLQGQLAKGATCDEAMRTYWESTP